MNYGKKYGIAMLCGNIGERIAVWHPIWSKECVWVSKFLHEWSYKGKKEEGENVCVNVQVMLKNVSNSFEKQQQQQQKQRIRRRRHRRQWCCSCFRQKCTWDLKRKLTVTRMQNHTPIHANTANGTYEFACTFKKCNKIIFFLRIAMKRKKLRK